MKKRPISLKASLVITILLCWLVPILIVVLLFCALLGNSYRQSMEQEINTSANRVLLQVQMQMEDVVKDSKQVSYDAQVPRAYREYLENHDEASMYSKINSYLRKNFTRDCCYQAVFITFWDPEIQLEPYVVSNVTTTHSLIQKYQHSYPRILEQMREADTQLRFIVEDGELYVVRNLLDRHFQIYASITIMMDMDRFFQPLLSLNWISEANMWVDDEGFRLEEGKVVPAGRGAALPELHDIFRIEADDHLFSFSVEPREFNPWRDNPWLIWAVIGAALLVLPMLFLVVVLFYRNVTRPVEVLSDAQERVQTGQRGYQIEVTPANEEFGNLYFHFNQMSRELENQFQRAYLEQQATQRAQIKALQSQINPHFLNNTLEIINWEARFAENDRVCAMIEALSTMLNAALDRDGRTQIPLSEELGYVDAYLYIIHERLGDGFRCRKEIDEGILSCKIPRLILQPIVENAVEHDLTPKKGGDLCVRAYRKENQIYLEVEHEGIMTAEDAEHIKKLLSDGNMDGHSVGICNVSQRLRLIYGSSGSLTIEQTKPGIILARIAFPFS